MTGASQPYRRRTDDVESQGEETLRQDTATRNPSEGAVDEICSPCDGYRRHGTGDVVMWRKILSDEFRDRAIEWLDRFGFIAVAILATAGILLLMIR